MIPFYENNLLKNLLIKKLMKRTDKNMKKLLALLLICAMVISGSTVVTSTTAAADTTATTKSLEYAAAMAPGWNLGNTFDSTGSNGEQSWGNPKVTKELIHTIKEQGFNSIRMPLTLDQRMGGAPDYKIDETYLNRYAEVVGWALDEGLYVMINIHHDSWIWANKIGSHDTSYMDRYKAIWTQLADYFKDYPDKLCFESLNEPQFTTGDTANQIKINTEVNDAFYHIVRSSGGSNATRMLVLPTLNTNDSADRCKALYDSIKGYKDDNIIATFHYYGFWPFSTNIAGTTTMDSQVVKELEGAFNRVHDQFIANGIGVICGEYGLLGFDKTLGAVEHGEVMKYFEYINYYAKQKNITMMLWDNGQHMGRTSLTWSDQSLYNIIKASWTGRSSYAESDRLFITDENKTKDLPVKLTLNGNSLVSICNGDTELVNGTDYTYKNGTVTLKASYLQSVITKEYGDNAALTLKFSAGADWTIYLAHYSKPVVGKGKGSTSAFTIPVTFNGSRLSTMEAVTDTGKGAGPNNWTTYKEFDKDFKVNYDSNTVTVTADFFKQTADGLITLKLHFWSGEIIEYIIQKNGSKITDAPAAPTVKSNSLNLNKGKLASITFNNLTKNAVVTYSSGNQKVATVSKDGRITAVNSGSTSIFITIKQNNLTYKLTVSLKVH